jgi:hypothetical protein
MSRSTGAVQQPDKHASDILENYLVQNKDRDAVAKSALPRGLAIDLTNLLFAQLYVFRNNRRRNDFTPAI